MKITATGWGRDMGPKRLGGPMLHGERLSDTKPVIFNTDTTYVEKIEADDGSDSIMISWHAELKLTGNYLVELSFTNEDLLYLFKHLFGVEINLENKTRIGLSIKDDVVLERVSGMKVGDLFGKLSNISED